MYKKIVYLIVSFIITVTVISEAEAKKGFYMGLGATYNTIDGKFNGSGGLKSDTDTIILPDIKNALGVDIQGGYGINDAWAVELNLMVSEHSGKWSGLTGDVSYASFSINGKYSFRSSDMTQPYLLFGISNNSLVIKNGSKNTATGEVGDATLSGPGVNFGAGIDAYLTPHVSLTLGIMYRYVDYTDASGVDHSGSINDGIDGSGLSVLLTTGYHF
jgi:opacity protein-like surface antigen